MEKIYTQALLLDEQDRLKEYRQEFLIPETADGKPAIYFCGNSLGLQPKSVKQYIEQELIKWKNQAVEGHFTEPDPWLSYHKLLKAPLAMLTGAKKHEVTAMNSLTTNLHLQMISFYQPTGGRYKILMEASAFPSDQYAVESQVRLHGYDPEDAIIEVRPEEGKETIATDQLLKTIEEHGESIALVLMPGIQYYTGQWFDVMAITERAHKAGAYAGFDMAHAMGNMPMRLHDWGVDFAVWCSYKYLNSGPGNTGGVFVHERHAANTELPRLAGWWGYDEASRFQMQKGFKPMYGVDGWQLSNVNVLSLSAQRASLDIIARAGITAMRQKSLQLTGFLEEGIRTLDPQEQYIKIITPSSPEQRGCQLSLFALTKGREIFEKLSENHVMVDWREPNVIRVAPTPLYNTFEEVYQFVSILKSVLAL